jgi:hypothetical protein
VFVLNAPYNGGTHLPDVTVIAPVFLDAAGPSPQPFPRTRGEGGRCDRAFASIECRVELAAAARPRRSNTR